MQQINKANGYGVPVVVKIVDEQSPLEEAIRHLDNHDLLVVGDSHADCFTTETEQRVGQQGMLPVAGGATGTSRLILA